jgi:hypothetical protein
MSLVAAGGTDWSYITNSRRVLENPLSGLGCTFEVDLHLAATLSMLRV